VNRVTLDSNVYLSGFVFGGKPKRVLEMAIDGEIEVAVSDPIIQEVRRHLLGSSGGRNRARRRPSRASRNSQRTSRPRNPSAPSRPIPTFERRATEEGVDPVPNRSEPGFAQAPHPSSRSLKGERTTTSDQHSETVH
jgi:hypothetical protein